ASSGRWGVGRPREGGNLPGTPPAAAAALMENYRRYFARHNARCGGVKTMLDPLPRVALVPGLGLFGLGRSKKDARIAADLAEAAVDVITEAEAIGRFESISEAEMFDMEYWSLEQAKLGNAVEKPLAGQVAVVTGAAGAIGALPSVSCTGSVRREGNGTCLGFVARLSTCRRGRVMRHLAGSCVPWARRCAP